VRVVAHRTCPLQHPENSLAGIRGAAEAGAYAVEVDVRLTRDHVPVLMHDPIPLRVARSPIPVRWRTAASFDRLHIRGSDQPPPRFAAAVEALPAGLHVAVDVKDPTAMAAAIATLVDGGRLADALLWSSGPAAVAAAERLAPDAERAYLRNTETEEAAIAYCADAAAMRAKAVSIMDVSLTPAVVAAGHDLGLVVYSWVRTLAAQDAVIAAGPDGIVTDWVAEARARLAAG